MPIFKGRREKSCKLHKPRKLRSCRENTTVPGGGTPRILSASARGTPRRASQRCPAEEGLPLPGLTHLGAEEGRRVEAALPETSGLCSRPAAARLSARLLSVLLPSAGKGVRPRGISLREINLNDTNAGRGPPAFVSVAGRSDATPGSGRTFEMRPKGNRGWPPTSLRFASAAALGKQTNRNPTTQTKARAAFVRCPRCLGFQPKPAGGRRREARPRGASPRHRVSRDGGAKCTLERLRGCVTGKIGLF